MQLAFEFLKDASLHFFTGTKLSRETEKVLNMNRDGKMRIHRNTEIRARKEQPRSYGAIELYMHV